MNKTLVYLFNKIYDQGKLTDLIVSNKDIKKICSYYKNNFEKENDYKNFLTGMKNLYLLLSKSPAALAEIAKQFNRKKALQPAILSECFTAQTIANELNLTEFIDSDDKLENIPTILFNAIVAAKGGELEEQIPRYIYFGKNKKIVLLQYGDSSSIDAVFVKDGYRVRLEIKEEKAKLGEYDLDYDDTGKLLVTDKIIKHHKEFLPVIDTFNKVTTVFDHQGKNFKIGSYLDKNTLKKICSAVYISKKIDLYILQRDNKIFAVPSNNLLDCVDASTGSEIRTAGRNNYAVFTHFRMQEVLNSIGGTVEKETITIPLHNVKIENARGKTSKSRIKFDSLFFVHYQNATINDDSVIFSLDSVRQNKSTISLHLYSFINLKALSDSFMALNSLSDSTNQEMSILRV